MKAKKSVMMLLSNPATHDVRPLKEALALTKRGFKVMILSWDREGNSPRLSLSGNLLIHRLNLRAPYGQNIRTFIGLLLFYAWCAITSFIYKFQVIHCHDADMFLCGVLLKIARLGRVKLIYDMHDHPIAFLDRFPVHNFIVKTILSMAKKYGDGIIVVNEGFVDYLSKIGFPREKITVIMNVPSKAISGNFRILNKNQDKFIIFYYGDISAQRGVDKLIEAVTGLESVELFLAGRGDLVPLLKNLENRCKNIKYLGWISISEIDSLIKKADLIPSLYMPDNINHILATPGKLFTAMAHGIPVLVPEGSYQAVIVKKYGCGIVVDMNNTAKVREAIFKLASSPDLCKKLGENGIKAVNELFNWQIMENRLIRIYNSFIF
ncbi:MAG: hypothetical protein DSO07_12700 [Thermoproteota archaeon]|jgi:glycosyltransferase involved in cell wall biosynthesis|nr:MAG: hypothetical protein DSO07_12700 [Candidatus Korarchaeota archaeon]